MPAMCGRHSLTRLDGHRRTLRQPLLLSPLHRHHSSRTKPGEVTGHRSTGNLSQHSTPGTRQSLPSTVAPQPRTSSASSRKCKRDLGMELHVFGICYPRYNAAPRTRASWAAEDTRQRCCSRRLHIWRDTMQAMIPATGTWPSLVTSITSRAHRRESLLHAVGATLCHLATCPWQYA